MPLGGGGFAYFQSCQALEEHPGKFPCQAISGAEPGGLICNGGWGKTLRAQLLLYLLSAPSWNFALATEEGLGKAGSLGCSHLVFFGGLGCPRKRVSRGHELLDPGKGLALRGKLVFLKRSESRRGGLRTGHGAILRPATQHVRERNISLGTGKSFGGGSKSTHSGKGPHRSLPLCFCLQPPLRPPPRPPPKLNAWI